jgi:hypothetical protein
VRAGRVAVGLRDDEAVGEWTLRSPESLDWSRALGRWPEG